MDIRSGQRPLVLQGLRCRLSTHGRSRFAISDLRLRDHISSQDGFDSCTSCVSTPKCVTMSLSLAVKKTRRARSPVHGQ